MGVHLYDSTDWQKIPADPPAVLWIVDGNYHWLVPTGATSKLGTIVTISALADPAAEEFDLEYGNATADQVATACSQRLDAKKWSVVYCNRSTIPSATAALRTKSINWAPAMSWPEPGVYLHVADPTGVDHTDVEGLPTVPVAVQWGWFPSLGYDVSTTLYDFPIPPAVAVPDPPAPPAAAQPEVIGVNVNRLPSQVVIRGGKGWLPLAGPVTWSNLVNVVLYAQSPNVGPWVDYSWLKSSEPFAGPPNAPQGTVNILANVDGTYGLDLIFATD